jgi:uncharacterized protein (DUF3820 family)
VSNELKKYLYISTGNLNGVYTLRSIISSPAVHQDKFIRRLSRNWDTAWNLGYLCAEKTGCIYLTEQTDEWALNEWGEGAKENIKEYYTWKSYLHRGEMPFGLHKNIRLEKLPWNYRCWLREQEPENKLWDMLRFYLRPWEDSDNARMKIVRQRRKAIANSEFVGTPKEHLRLKLTCIAKSAYDSFYGGGMVSTMLDENGNVIKTFGRCPIEKGETKKVKFIVKKHNTFRGNKETLVTHVLEDKNEKNQESENENA